MVPFVPILEEGQSSFAIFVDLQIQYDWVLDVIVYPSADRLVEVLEDVIVRPAEAMFNKLLERRAGQERLGHFAAALLTSCLGGAIKMLTSRPTARGSAAGNRGENKADPMHNCSTQVSHSDRNPKVTSVRSATD
jgi:hypothetical protein